MILRAYRSIGGVHPETASIRNILAFHDVTAPHTGSSFSEAMVLGIGGGLGACYMLWEMKKHGYPSLMLTFRNRSNYGVPFLKTLCERFGAGTQVHETASEKKAARQLEETLTAGQPAIVWLDLGGAPYYLHHLSVGVAVAFGFEGDTVLVDNLAAKPYALPAELLATARAKVPSFRNRLMVVSAPGPFQLEQAVQAGLQDCVEYLSATSTSFSLPAIRKWARHMTDTNNKKGWPTVFRDGRGLYGTLRTVYEAIEHVGTGGGGMRWLYAEFLEEAASVLDLADLKVPAAHYRDLNARWRALAQAALPDSIGIFKITKELLDRRATLLRERGSEGLPAVAPISDELHAIKGELNPDFPLSGAETSDLFTEIQSHLEGIYQAEKEALAALKSAVGA